ncbi:GTP-binding protein Di-Ras1-like isoform X2 [Daktulosphaira vitifoliae]|uniref:GTP-binding protein Di-Ras1-like isoform X2 n=1 Tax=Daktulosphaira vitifoliae TaxID=58002 RepID=UPI0021AA8E7A|nr:GTP-binding protein Di-Ras1-like isoform X2 [Daktulosphaira vitifoliae]
MYRIERNTVIMPSQQQERIRLSSMGGDSTCSNGSSGGGGSTVMKIRRRIVMMGAARVGKTSIITQFLYDRFPNRYKETIEELHRGDYELPDGSRLTLDILDTSGAYQFPAMRELSINTADAFLLVFSVDREDTWDQIKHFKEQIIQRRGPTIPIVIVANKCELSERFLPIEITEAIAKYDWECGYVECSAKDNRNIVGVFKELLSQAKVQYNLSPAVKRRRMSLPNYVENHSGSAKGRYMLKRNSCTVA